MSMDQGEFAYGAGHVDPIKAVNPGLVYEVDKSDHINFLCGMNYILKMLQLISGEAVTCTGKTLPKNLNYPSMTARVAAGKQFQVNFSRTLRNLGMRSTYKAEVSGSKFDVRVIPEALSLNTMHEKESFELTLSVSGNGSEDGKLVSAHLKWSDGVHIVRNPIVIYA
ncbi:LOW QUALITY PROTEIN: subtilisin-like protease SBT4.5 [Brassica rapa]|uniref:LOW QUALITY PROTEIN: subtilisin-like protease SBT4.5 n=1 Tax=Brassica campestris TaxID=3711 RepID=UPI00142DBD2F|nr:LOW QUALITY PROTEIN: subtilisin-like protease SBT4.5 [Brassica rapa]